MRQTGKQNDERESYLHARVLESEWRFASAATISHEPEQSSSGTADTRQWTHYYDDATNLADERDTIVLLVLSNEIRAQVSLPGLNFGVSP